MFEICLFTDHRETKRFPVHKKHSFITKNQETIPVQGYKIFHDNVECFYERFDGGPFPCPEGATIEINLQNLTGLIRRKGKLAVEVLFPPVEETLLNWKRFGF